MTLLQEKDAELYEWLESSVTTGEKVLYFSIGTECIWLQWAIDAIYNGCLEIDKSIKIRVVWSLPTINVGLPENYDKNKFWVSTYLPQVEILNHRSVVAGISHCGFGGTLEFISSGIPVLTLGHFSD